MSVSDIIKKGATAPLAGDLIEGGIGIDTTGKQAYYKAADSSIVKLTPVKTVAGREGNVVVTQTDVGLPLVENTADIDKVVSTATTAAITSSMDTHEAAVDPHTQYLTSAEGTAAYLAIGAKAADSQLLDGVDRTAFVRSNTNDTISGILTSSAQIRGITPVGTTDLTRKDYVDSKASVGISQTWTDVTGSRSDNVTYTNSTGRPITVAYTVYTWGASEIGDRAYVGATLVAQVSTPFNDLSQRFHFTMSFVVPVGATYRIDTMSALASYIWMELK